MYCESCPTRATTDQKMAGGRNFNVKENSVKLKSISEDLNNVLMEKAKTAVERLKGEARHFVSIWSV